MRSLQTIKIIASFAIGIFFSLPLLSTAQATESLSQREREQVIELIRETLTKDPEIIMEALDVLRKRREQAEALQKKTALAENKSAIFNDPLTPIAGNPKGDVSLVEFFDYNCGYCKRVFPVVMELVKKDKDLRYVIKEYPILGDSSIFAAKAALAAKMQDKYFEMHVGLMQTRGGLSKEKIMAIAEQVGLDTDKLEKDMASDEINQALQNNFILGQSLGISGTPAFIIGDEIIPGAIGLDQLEAKIDGVRKSNNER